MPFKNKFQLVITNLNLYCKWRFIMKTEQQYKDLTVKEFTKAAQVYETDHAGIYEMCREDYPYIEKELLNHNLLILILSYYLFLII